MTPLLLENETLRLAALPQLGGKVISFYVKTKSKELLFPPSRPYRLPCYGDDFSAYDTSGWDEMLPTIDPCQWNSISLPDHGDLWSIPWEMELTNNTLIGKVVCRSLPFRFTRSITFIENTCVVNYKIENLSHFPQPYLWAWHALWNLENLKINIPSLTTVIPVHENTFLGEKDKAIPWPCVRGHDLSRPFCWKGEKKTKVYISPELILSSVFLHWPEVTIHITWESEKIPYLGIWYNHGGFKGEYNIAIEPATGYYDRLDTAYNNKKITILPPYETHTWNLYLHVLL